MCQKEGWPAILALMLCVKEYSFNATQRQHLFFVDCAVMMWSRMNLNP